jgi:hypothetical protein
VVKDPFLISASDGTLEVTSPVACHMPRGGLEFMKDWRREAVRDLVGEDVLIVVPALLDEGGRCDVWMDAGCWPLPGTESMGESAGKASVAGSVGLVGLAMVWNSSLETGCDVRYGWPHEIRGLRCVLTVHFVPMYRGI